jgi:cytochrome c-type biogenesis protein CcmH/NrfF
MRHILSAIILLGFTAALAGAQIPEGVEGSYQPHPEARKAIDGLLSPYCPGLMLEQCPAEESRILRDSIHALALEGWTSDELTAWMLANHGSEWQAVPDRSGSGLLAWLLPPLALVVGFGAVVFVARRFTRSEEGLEDGRQDQSGRGDPSPEEEVRLKEALRELELAEDPSFQ